MSEPTVIAPVPRASPLDALRARIEAASARALGGATAIGAVAALVGTWVTGGWGDAALILGAIGWVAGGIAALRHRARIAALPFEISGTGLVNRSATTRTYRFRARLGRGRRVRDVRAEVVHQAADGRAIRLATARLPPVIGPFTVLAIEHAGEEAEGVLVLRVSGREGARRWEAERAFPHADLRAGRFHAGAVRRGGRLVLDLDAWDAVLPTDPSVTLD